MPTICVFYGITIRMYYDDHNPPHFHIYYGDFAAKVAIDTDKIIAGQLPAAGVVYAQSRQSNCLPGLHS